MLQCERKLDDLFAGVLDTVKEQLKDKLYYEQRSNLPTTEIVDQTIANYLAEILSNEKVIAKLAKLAQKELMAQHNNNVLAEKEELRKKKALWKITKGNIPCLCKCGHHNQYEKEEFLYGRGTGEFVCKDCSDKLKEEGKSIMDYFKGGNSLYKIYGIE